METGIVATSIREGEDKVFFFNTSIQSEVENFMTILDYGCDEYFLSFGKLKKVPKP